MLRRTFLKALAALPIVGKLVPVQETLPEHEQWQILVGEPKMFIPEPDEAKIVHDWLRNRLVITGPCEVEFRLGR